MYTAGQTTDSILHNTPLSAHGFTAAARAAGMNQDWEHHPASVNYVPDYRSRRLFGNLPLAQATGDLPPVHLNGKVTYMNPTHMQGVVVGRGQCLATGEYVGGEVSLRPLGSYGGLAGGYRVDDVVHTGAVQQFDDASDVGEVVVGVAHHPDAHGPARQATFSSTWIAHALPSPMTCVSPRRAFGTWRLPASPRRWVEIS